MGNQEALPSPLLLWGLGEGLTHFPEAGGMEQPAGSTCAESFSVAILSSAYQRHIGHPGPVLASAAWTPKRRLGEVRCSTQGHAMGGRVLLAFQRPFFSWPSLELLGATSCSQLGCPQGELLGPQKHTHSLAPRTAKLRLGSLVLARD